MLYKNDELFVSVFYPESSSATFQNEVENEFNHVERCFRLRDGRGWAISNSNGRNTILFIEPPTLQYNVELNGIRRTYPGEESVHLRFRVQKATGLQFWIGQTLGRQ